MRRSRVLQLLVLLVAALMVMAAPIAAAKKSGGGDGGDGAKGKACPEQTPGFGDTPPPGCGHPRCPDQDGDGVCDPDDACPTVPGTQPNGCPPPCEDPDGDGVCGPADKCPTVPGTQPDGCPEPECPASAELRIINVNNELVSACVFVVALGGPSDQDPVCAEGQLPIFPARIEVPGVVIGCATLLPDTAP